MKKTGFLLGAAALLLAAFVLTGCVQPTNSNPRDSAGSITGRALYQDGGDNAGITVVLEKTDGLRAVSVTASARNRSLVSRAVDAATTTNADGAYTFTEVAAGTYTIYATSQNSTEKAVTTNVTVEAGRAVTAADLKLTAAGSLTGTVTVNGNSTGNTGVLVFIFGTSYMAMTNDSGVFTISDVPAGSGYQVVAMKGSFTGILGTYTVTGGETTQIDAQDLTITETGEDGIVWQGDLSSAPKNPQVNWAYYDTVQKKSFIWDGTAWRRIAQDGADGVDGAKGDTGAQGEKGDTGNTGTAGAGIVWKGALAAAPANPQTNWAYYNTTDRGSYIYSDGDWHILAGNGPILTLFSFDISQNPGLPQDLLANVTYDDETSTYTFSTLEWIENINSLKAVFESIGEVTVNGIIQKSGITANDFRQNVVYRVVADNTQRDYTIVFESPQTTGLPVMKIDTGNRLITSTEVWLEGVAYTIFDHSGEEIINGSMDIKGRGNTTWGMPKKPYSLKLSKKGSLLGMPEHKRWVLLANYSDKTLLRTDTAFKIGSVFDAIAWTPRSEHISLYLNGEYAGAYQLTEAIKIDANRVNVTQTISKKKPDGGYVLEIDTRKVEVFNFTTTKGVVFCCSDPDDELDEIITGDTKTIFEKIKADVQNVEDVLYSENFADPEDGYGKYIDVASFVDWYLVNEITKNNDAVFHTSVYMYYDPDKKKYCMGPLWDFDISLGNINYNGNDNPEGFWIKNSGWIARLFTDPSFVSLVKNRWNAKKDEVSSLVSYIDERASLLSKSQKINFEKWDILGIYVWPNKVVTGSYQGEIDYLKTFLTQRMMWLDTAINALGNP
jgi:hypothetical protein